MKSLAPLSLFVSSMVAIPPRRIHRTATAASCPSRVHRCFSHHTKLFGIWHAARCDCPSFFSFALAASHGFSDVQATAHRHCIPLSAGVCSPPYVGLLSPPPHTPYLYRFYHALLHTSDADAAPSSSHCLASGSFYFCCFVATSSVARACNCLCRVLSVLSALLLLCFMLL